MFILQVEDNTSIRVKGNEVRTEMDGMEGCIHLSDEDLQGFIDFLDDPEALKFGCDCTKVKGDTLRVHRRPGGIVVIVQELVVGKCLLMDERLPELRSMLDGTYVPVCDSDDEGETADPVE